jgi:SAM-dependent methyltransferase
MNEFEKQFQSLQSEDAETKKRKEIDRIKERIFDRETPEAYKELAKKVGIIELKEPYANNLLRTFYQGYHDYPGSDPSQELSELGKLISEEAKDGTVLDLGCGKTQWMSFFFRKNQADLYIGVDLEPDVFVPAASTRVLRSHAFMALSNKRMDPIDSDLTSGILNKSAEEHAEEATIEIIDRQYRLQDNVFEIQDDMLCAISRMKDESVDMVIVSGIETSFKNPEETKEYLHALDVEIRRVLKKSGIVLNYESDVSVGDMEQVMGSGDRHVNWKVLRKPDSETS